LQRSRWRLVLVLLTVPVAVVVFGSLFVLAAEHLEGRETDFWSALEWALAMLSGAGSGILARGTHPLTVTLTILAQLFGMLFLVLAIPFCLRPYLEERFEARLPHCLPPMRDVILFYHYSSTIESVLDECQQSGTAFVIVEEDMALARRLRNRGYDVVFGKMDDDSRLLSGVEGARALVANGPDQGNAMCILSARENGFEGPIYALAEDLPYRPPLLQVGASEVLTPLPVLVAGLAARASTHISPPIEGLRLLNSQVGVAEFRVRASSPLAGVRLSDLHLRVRHGVTVIGQWVNGSFAAAVRSETRIEPGAILVVVGAHANLAKVERLAIPVRRRGPIVVAGYGVVGRRLVELLIEAGETTTVVDRQPIPGVDVVGNVLEHATLERARVCWASAVVLALSNDSEAIFATAVVRDHAPEVPLIVRAERTANVARLYQAGADCALSLGQIAGRTLSYYLRGEQAVAIDSRLRFIRVSPGALVGGHPVRGRVRERAGALVVAVERGPGVIVDFEDDFSLRADDSVLVCGTSAELTSFVREFRTTPVHGPRL